MTKEDIISIAIHEAFNCGKEAGEAYQRMWSDMNQKIEDAKQGKHTGDVALRLECVPGNRIGSDPDENVGKLEAEVNELGRICEEKDATITELRKELELTEQKLKVEIEEVEHLHQELAWLRAVCASADKGKTAKEMKVEDPTDCIYYSEGDKVIISGQHFADPSSRYIGRIVDVTRDYARVSIQGGDMDGEEHNVPYNMLSHLLETESPKEEVDAEHHCTDCIHSIHSIDGGDEKIYCCLKEQEYDKDCYACGSFNSLPRKKKLPETEP